VIKLTVEKTHRLKIEIEFVSRGFNSLNHNLMMYRTGLETLNPFPLAEVTKFEVEEIKRPDQTRASETSRGK